MSLLLGTPIYWAGPQKAYRYQLRRGRSGRGYVRYLPPGAPARATDGRFRIVATYPFSGAVDSLRAVARGKAIAGPGRSIEFKAPRSVYLAFRGWSAPEIEVYEPQPSVAARIASSGRVRPVAG